MKLKRVVPLLAIIALLIGALAACSPKSGGSNGKTVIEIGSQSPLSGGSATLGDAIRLGAKLAIEDRQKEFEKKGFQIKIKRS
ncbi:branched-chain amino acid ABC transporter, amino acid-binding protein [Sporolactobacillus inulinus]|uniref:Branched-chain amino acid ABC transporter, amino acid-binding protein n=1 Tax=Sporolactobacillus inulinus TaxID=2078 RepID=A0A4Y1ZAE6_9BACL|nr:branched-chain amino acid ABC transporter, amino acid-binding protein [Sporolactobacillus inulinus]